MKRWLERLLILGGIYFFVVPVFTVLEIYVPSIVYLKFIVDLAAFICTMLLVFNCRIGFISKIQDEHPKTKSYLLCVGWLPYVFSATGAILREIILVKNIFNLAPEWFLVWNVAICGMFFLIALVMVGIVTYKIWRSRKK